MPPDMSSLLESLGTLSKHLPGNSTFIGPPRRHCATVEEWYQSLSGKDRLRHVLHWLSPEQVGTRNDPKQADEEILLRIREFPPPKLAARFVAVIEDGRYWGRGHGNIIAPDDVLLCELSPSLQNFELRPSTPAEHESLRYPLLPRMQRLKGLTMALQSPYSYNFHHFLLDTVPKFELLKQSGISLDDIDHFICDYRGRTYQKELLEVLGINQQRIIVSNSKLHVECEHLIAPSFSEPSSRLAYQYSPQGMQFLRSLFLSTNSKQYRRLLVSRRKAKVRRWLGEAEAFPKLQKLGFELVELENLSLAVQARLFSEAEMVVMPHGGGLANCAFCAPGTAVVELFSRDYMPLFMVELSSTLALEYYAFAGNPVTVPGQMHSDIDVAADKVIDLVQSIIAER
ncbi:MAG: glycosyltransferase family 61 protein [Candidatus Obscuribacterales bacterium]|nr:glycosyltransferase family 61 protein [Candidatus Obscuribacterales bacterium]